MKSPLVPAVLAVHLLSTASLPAAAPRTDAEGFPLPAGVLTRIGSARFRPGGWDERRCWSPDGKQLATAGSGVRLWDFGTGKLVRSVPPADARDGIKALAFSADGRLLAAVESDKDKAFLAVLDPATGNLVKRSLGFKADLETEWALSHEGRWLAVAREREILLFDTATAKEPRRFTSPKDVDKLVVDDSGRWIVLSFEKENVVLDTQQGSRASPTGKTFYGDIAVAHRKRLFARINRKQDPHTIEVFSLQDMSRRQRFFFADEEPSPTAIAFSPDDRAILVACEESEALALHDLEARKWRWQVRTYPLQPRSAAFSPDGKVIALPGSVFLDAATGKLDPHTPDLFAHPTPIAFPGPRQILIESCGFEIRDTVTGRLVRRLPSIPREKCFVPWEWGTAPFTSAADKFPWKHRCSHDGNQVFAFTHRGFRADGRTGKAFPCPDILIAKWTDVVCSSDGASIICEAYHLPQGHSVQVWDTAKGVERHSLFDVSGMDHYHFIPCDNPRLLLTCTDTTVRFADKPLDGTVRLWDIVTGRRVATFHRRGEPSRFCLPAISADGGTVAAPSWKETPGGSEQPQVECWEVKTARRWPTASRELEKGAPQSIALAPGGGMAALGCSDGRLLLWEVASGKVRGTLRHEGSVWDVRFSPDSRLLAATSAEAPLYLWDVYGTADEAAPQRPLAALWEDLKADDAARAFAAIKQLIRSPREAAEFLKAKLKPLSADEERLRRLVADLDSPDFETRQRATAALQELDERADAFLRAARKKATAQEVQRRLDRILRRPIHVGPEVLRALRAIEVLEVIGGPEATAALERMAAGPPEDRLTEVAKEAMARIQGRKKI